MIVGNATTTAPMLGSDRSMAGGHRCRHYGDNPRGRRQERRVSRRQQTIGRNGWRTQLRRGQL